MTNKRPDKPRAPDIEFTADIKAKKLRFEEVPETEVRFRGHPGHESASGTDRENLPDEVEPHVTYKDPKVRLRIASAIREEDPDWWKSPETAKARGKNENRRRAQ